MGANTFRLLICEFLVQNNKFVAHLMYFVNMWIALLFFEAKLYRHLLCRYNFARVAAAIGEWRAHTHTDARTHSQALRRANKNTHTHTEMLARTHTGE